MSLKKMFIFDGLVVQTPLLYGNFSNMKFIKKHENHSIGKKTGSNKENARGPPYIFREGSGRSLYLNWFAT